MPKNITLAIDEDLLDKARVLAAIRRTSVNEMVRGFLRHEVEREQQNYAASQQAHERDRKHSITTRDDVRFGDPNNSNDQARVTAQAGVTAGDLPAPQLVQTATRDTASRKAATTATNGSIRLAEKLSQFDDRWSPRTITTFNDNDVMVVKVEGEFNWHKHDDTDDFFHVLAGRLEIDVEGEATATLYPGDILVVPKGKLHRPRTINGVAHLLLIEPTGTPNTGNAATAAPRQDL